VTSREGDLHALEVWTARISYAGPSRFDITRKTAWLAQKARKPAPGDPFAPSWLLLKSGQSRNMPWEQYAAAYLTQMRLSYRVYRPAWDALLARKRVVLVCFCKDVGHCHRRLLAEALQKLGAEYKGERPSAGG